MRSDAQYVASTQLAILSTMALRTLQVSAEICEKGGQTHQAGREFQ